MAEKRFMVLGNAGVSLTCTSEGNTISGQTHIVRHPYQFEPTGLGAMTAIAAAKLGADAVLATRLGKDFFGRYLLDVFTHNRIDTRAIKIDDTHETSLTVSFKQTSGKVTSLYHPGANSGISSADAEDAFLSYPDALLIHMDCNEHTLKSAVDFANQHSIPIFCEPSPAKASLQLIHSPEILTPSEDQVLAFTGIYPDSVDNMLAAADQLYRATNAKYVVIRLQRRGSFIYDGKYHEIISNCDLPCLDTRGYENAYLAAISLFYISTKDIKKSVRFANTVGAIVESKSGGYASLPDLATVTDVMQKNNISL